MDETGKISEKGKEKAASPVRTRDFVKTQAQEKLTLHPQRELGMNQGEPSRQEDTINPKTMLAKQMIEGFEKAYETNKKLYPCLDQYALSKTKEVFRSEYAGIYEKFENWKKMGLSKEEIFNRIDYTYAHAKNQEQ